jgi:hypothetical protein
MRCRDISHFKIYVYVMVSRYERAKSYERHTLCTMWQCMYFILFGPLIPADHYVYIYFEMGNVTTPHFFAIFALKVPERSKNGPKKVPILFQRPDFWLCDAFWGKAVFSRIGVYQGCSFRHCWFIAWYLTEIAWYLTGIAWDLDAIVWYFARIDR